MLRIAPGRENELVWYFDEQSLRTGFCEFSQAGRAR